MMNLRHTVLCLAIAHAGCATSNTGGLPEPSHPEALDGGRDVSSCFVGEKTDPDALPMSIAALAGRPDLIGRAVRIRGLLRLDFEGERVEAPNTPEGQWVAVFLLLRKEVSRVCEGTMVEVEGRVEGRKPGFLRGPDVLIDIQWMRPVN